MNWDKLLQPNLVLGDSVLGLTPDIIQQYELEGLVLDVDETLVPFHETQTTEEVRSWLKSLQPSLALWLVSNNLNENRIRRIAHSLEVPYLTGAGKPSRRKLRQATSAMNLPIQRVAMVGDRLFTDVLAGNRLGMFTILVEPMSSVNQGKRKRLVYSFEVWLSEFLGVSQSPSKR
ncbi:MAG: YqeG family HAD IIIA-type phosphatase [Leptolyngbyaceae cyanobacterium MO_188.B28]|nr:YqeG family HAD IIIA-type phosphatase [Leptolyngbyaceae cyanobacterium MO_188.B28]